MQRAPPPPPPPPHKDENEEDEDDHPRHHPMFGHGGGSGSGCNKEASSSSSSSSYLFDPYNAQNKLITVEEITHLLGKYGIGEEYRIQNFNLFKRAFVHRSYVKRPNAENAKNGIQLIKKPENCLPLFKKSNERLEFLGDGLLELITKFYLYRRFPKENEGFMTEKKIALVKNESIGKIAFEMGIHKWFILSNHAEQKQTRTNLKKLGCLFESFIGALFLECNKIQIQDEDKWFGQIFITGPGFQMVQLFVENIFEKHVDWTYLINNDDNFKNIFQVVIQKEFKVTPEYYEIVVNEDPPQHQPQQQPEQRECGGGGGSGGGGADAKSFRMGVYLSIGNEFVDPNTIATQNVRDFCSFKHIHESIASSQNKLFLFFGEGMHKNKKKAEQLACKDAIRQIARFSSSSSSSSSSSFM